MAQIIPHYWTPSQVRRRLDELADQGKAEARTLCLMMWRTGLRIGEALALEWRDLDYAGDPPTLLVREVKDRDGQDGPPTSRPGPDFSATGRLATVPGIRVVALTRRTALRHVQRRDSSSEP